MTAILFDLDGTLVDSLDDIAASTNHVLEALGLAPRARGEIARFVGDGARMLIRRALGERIDLEDDALARFRRHYFSHLTARSRPYEGIEALLEELARRGVRMAILSNKPHEATLEVVRALLPGHAFVAVLGQREGVPKKPDPAGALEALVALGGEAREVLFVGDTPVDVETATRASMVPVGVTWGYRTPEELREAGAAHVIATPGELLDLLPPP